MVGARKGTAHHEAWQAGFRRYVEQRRAEADPPPLPRRVSAEPIRDFVEHSGLPLRYLAGEADMDHAWLRRIVNHGKYVHRETAERIARGWGVDPVDWDL